MAAVLGTLIVTVCATSPGTYISACTNALEAGVQQSGLRSEVDSFEDSNVREMNRHLIEALGANNRGIIGGTVFLAEALANKKLVLVLPTYRLCNSLKAELTPDLTQLSAGWTF